MIKLESAHIEEFRGIKRLDIDFRKSTFAISGPNGSGKSGVIDAIEFGLTGQIGRLSGTGTQGLSVAEHGPHVDKSKFPDAAYVELKVFLPELNKSATLTRKISTPKKPKVVPDEEDVKAALAQVAEHPEIALSRREILRFILVEPSKRSEEIQSLLKLDDIGKVRSALNSAQRKLQTVDDEAVATLRASEAALQTHLQIPTLKGEDVLAAINQRRKILQLDEFLTIGPDTKLDAGVDASDPKGFNKASALRDIQILTDLVSESSLSAGTPANAIVEALSKLDQSPKLRTALKHRSFIEQGQELISGPICPFCDTDWDDESSLREHIAGKIVQSKEAQEIIDDLRENGTSLASEVVALTTVLTSVTKLADAENESDIASALLAWKVELEQFRTKLQAIEALMSIGDRLKRGWPLVPKQIEKDVATLSSKIKTKPDQTATVEAQTFLAASQARLEAYREASRRRKMAENALAAAKEAYGAYCVVMDDELETLYDVVQGDFSIYYRALNEDDEAAFTAKFSPSAGKLGLDVNFYERGLFPPGAYHSEGHQDGMGVCLYLALMKHLFDDHFTFALLDDVVMSVDVGHRRQFCKLLRTCFPNTQFIITTHDRVWAEQMRSSGLVSSKTSLAFHSWTIDTGPLVESNAEIWVEIRDALAKGKVEVAAAALRQHLEFISRLLADNLGALVVFRSDGGYDLGDLLPNVIHRMRELYGKAADAAQSWSNIELRDEAVKRKEALSRASVASNVEQWAVNKAVHYNEWANFGRKDFEPVIGAFEKLLACFSCVTCGSWLYVSPAKGTPEALRCDCNAISFNLKHKSK
jgi:recombinational DNA repair ATPase RecF